MKIEQEEKALIIDAIDLAVATISQNIQQVQDQSKKSQARQLVVDYNKIIEKIQK